MFGQYPHRDTEVIQQWHGPSARCQDKAAGYESFRATFDADGTLIGLPAHHRSIRFYLGAEFHGLFQLCRDTVLGHQVAGIRLEDGDGIFGQTKTRKAIG